MNETTFMDGYAIAGASSGGDSAIVNDAAANTAIGKNNLAAGANFLQCFLGGPFAYSDTGLGGWGLVPCAVGVAAQALVTRVGAEAVDQVVGVYRSLRELFGCPACKKRSEELKPPESAPGPKLGLPQQKLGDLTPGEVNDIQGVVDRLQQQIDAEFPNAPRAETRVEITVTGSAARGERRNVGTNLPIGHDKAGARGTTKSDIDIVVDPKFSQFFEVGYDTPHDQLPQHSLPSFDWLQGVLFGKPRPGPVIRFRAGEPPTYDVVPPPPPP
jgi:hypothetical protein